MHKWNYIKIRDFCTAKVITKLKDNLNNRRKYFKKLRDKELMSRIYYQEIKTLDTKIIQPKMD